MKKINLSFIFLFCTFGLIFLTSPANCGELELDGFDDYVWIPDSSSLNISGSTITMEAKVKLNSTTSNHWIVCKQDIDSIRSYGFYITTYGNTISPSIQTTGDQFEGEVGSGVLNYGTWHHIAVVYDGSKVKTYIDGQFNGEADLIGNLQQTGRDLYIGGTYWNSEDTINGSIDEVRIWNIARTQTEIQSTMSSTLAGNEAGLVGYWQFETLEDLGIGSDGADDFRDLTGYANHGDLYRTTMISGTITGLSAGQYINVNANDDNGTPQYGSDDLNYGTGVTGSGTGTDT